MIRYQVLALQLSVSLYEIDLTCRSKHVISESVYMRCAGREVIQAFFF